MIEEPQPFNARRIKTLLALCCKNVPATDTEGRHINIIESESGAEIKIPWNHAFGTVDAIVADAVHKGTDLEPIGMAHTEEYVCVLFYEWEYDEDKTETSATILWNWMKSEESEQDSE